MNNSPIPSGMYLCEPLVLHTSQITNPYFHSSSPLEQEEKATGSDARKLLKTYSQGANVFVVKKPVVMDYAAELVRAVRVIKERRYELVLCPLRGARMPGIQARAMSDNADIFHPFDGTGMAQGINDERILRDLAAIMTAASPPSEPRQVGVLDTAIGGDSCVALTRLLRQLSRQLNQHWRVRFHLIHASQSRPPRATNAYSYSTKDFQVEIDYHPVADLLIEDEPALLGYDTKWDGTQTVINRFKQDGQIVYCEGETTTVFRKAPLDEAVIAVVSNEISQQIQGLADAKLIEPDQWRKHMKP